MKTKNNRILVLVLATIALLLSGCFASSSVDSYQTETAKAIIDSGNNICFTVFLAAVIQAIFNK
jgi:PBP1b-binding outer membrane lipoprotein LpoB